MCGIAGFVDASCSRAGPELAALAGAMARSLAHRGPDGHGVWVDRGCGVALGHQRLAVIDPSPAGRQPMVSACGQYALCYNGETYNFRELRQELERAGCAFRTTTDTEVVLQALIAWGVRSGLERLDGMFAFAFWDRGKKRLSLARDRLGIKPLYFGRQGDLAFFASELKALHRHPGIALETFRSAMALYLRRGYIPAPWTIYRHVHKLPAGGLVDFAVGANGLDEKDSVWWSLAERAGAAAAAPWSGSLDDAAAEAEVLLQGAVRRQLVSDVPLGAFLSGGIDSALISALMRRQVGRARTFSIAFSDPQYDEAPHARAVAEHLGTEHTEFAVTGEQALAAVSRLPDLYDEPYGDSSAIPTLLLCSLARKHVTVALSGDGGDEFFCGYPRYLHGLPMWRRLRRLPWPVRKSLAAVASRLPLGAWELACTALRSRHPDLLRHRHAGDIARRLPRLLMARSSGEVYAALMSHWHDQALSGLACCPAIFEQCRARQEPADDLRSMMLEDAASYLPDDILVKVDRASMGAGLEVRVPLLDHRLAEWSMRLPGRLLCQAGKGKLVLRRILERLVPAALIDRPKKGFGVPLASWLRGPLREWADALIQPARLAPGLAAGPVLAAWREHQSGTHDRSAELWDVLMLQAWQERWGRGCGDPGS